MARFLPVALLPYFLTILLPYRLRPSVLESLGINSEGCAALGILMRPVVVKVTSKNQITLPGALMRELCNPGHFKAYVHGGNLVLFPAALATLDD